jgi:hypothetical protein
MDNISSARIERLGPDAEQDSEPPPGSNPKRKMRNTSRRAAPSVDLQPNEEKEFNPDDLDFDATPAPEEKHQLDEQG